MTGLIDINCQITELNIPNKNVHVKNMLNKKIEKTLVGKYSHNKNISTCK